MTSHAITLTFDQFNLSSAKVAESHAFRIVLLPGELLRVPRKHRALRVVSGSAWVSHDGRDQTLTAGEIMPLKRTRHDALVSAEGQTLFLEIA
jgi:hypothetical protein